MGNAIKNQNFQDWITQQWVILFGKKINKSEHNWLLGPFGGSNGIGKKFIKQLSENEQLIEDNQKNIKGLIQSIHQLNLSPEELNSLSKNVIDFYENTSNYDLKLKVKWNPFFIVFALIIKFLFSKRIEQLNVPLSGKQNSQALSNEIIYLRDSRTNEIKYTIWLRTFLKTREVVYSGIYGTCVIPSGKTCLKAIFPLPHGNASVILSPKVGKDGELILESSGNQLGDCGFYFLLKDNQGDLWTKYIKSFRDTLVVKNINNKISASQNLTLSNMKVVRFEYEILKKPTHLNGLG